MDCKECIFSTWLDKRQTGCLANRIDKLVAKDKAVWTEKDGSSYYTLHQFCNLYRQTEWKDAAESKDSDELIDKALNEIKPPFGIVAHCDHNHSIEDITKTIDSLKQINYNTNKVKVVLSTNNLSDYNAIVHLTNVIKEKFQASESIFHLHEEISLRDTECFKKIVQAMYFVKIKAGKTIDPELFNTINIILNNDLKQVCMFESDEVTVIMKKIMTECYLEFNNYDLAIDHIRNICIKQDKYEKI